MRVGFTFAFFVALAAISRLGSGAPGPPDPGTQLMLDYPDQVRYFPFDEAVQRSKITGRPIFLLFTNPKCGPCISLHLAILSEPNEAAFINTHYVPVKAMYKLAAVDGVTLSASDRSLQERFHPKGAPTLVLVAPDGRELTRSGWGGRQKTSRLLHRVARENAGPRYVQRQLDLRGNDN